MAIEQLQILPLCVIMLMGPQILTAIFLVTSREATKNSLAMIEGEGPSTVDYVVAGLLALLAIRVFRTRGTAEVPKWMSALQEAEPRRAFTLGFLLILLMPTDIAATISTANFVHDADLDPIDGWPLVAGTVLLDGLALHRLHPAWPPR